MLLTPFMTALASQPRTKSVQSQNGAVCSVGSMAVKALHHLPSRDLSPYGFVQIVGHNVAVSRRIREPLFELEVADKALVEVPVLFEHPGLGVLAENPVNGQSH